MILLPGSLGVPAVSQRIKRVPLLLSSLTFILSRLHFVSHLFLLPFEQLFNPFLHPGECDVRCCHSHTRRRVSPRYPTSLFVFLAFCHIAALAAPLTCQQEKSNFKQLFSIFNSIALYLSSTSLPPQSRSGISPCLRSPPFLLFSSPSLVSWPRLQAHRSTVAS